MHRVVVLSLAALLSAAQAPPPATGQSQRLFNGKDLRGWEIVNGVFPSVLGLIVAAMQMQTDAALIGPPGMRFSHFLAVNKRGDVVANASYFDSGRIEDQDDVNPSGSIF